jgi:maltose O-acetyltransferase
MKNHIKSFARNTGLMPTAKLIKRIIGYKVPTGYYSSLKLYLFNNLITFFPSHPVRTQYLKKVLGIKIGRATFIHMGAKFDGDIRIGKNSVIGRGCVFQGNITIKDNVSITAETYIFTSSHHLDSPMFEGSHNKVIIEDFAWIGARAMILPGVRIGKGAVLGASSTATKEIPDYEVYAGIPAKKVGTRNSKLNYRLNYYPFWA